MTLGRVESHDEGDLVRRAQAGDTRAFGILVGIHQHEVFTLALRLTNDRELAADVGQEAFVRAWRGLPRFRGDAAFSTWMHRIVVNAAWTLRRRARRHAAATLDDALSVVEDPGQTPEQSADTAELRSRLHEALGRLNRPQRSVVVMKDVYGWSHEEIADALGITVTAAKVRLHRARKRLRALLAGERS